MIGTTTKRRIEEASIPEPTRDLLKKLVQQVDALLPGLSLVHRHRLERSVARSVKKAVERPGHTQVQFDVHLITQADEEYGDERRAIVETLMKLQPDLWEETHGPNGSILRALLGTAESIEAVIARDNERVAELGLTHEAIADELERVLQAAMDYSHSVEYMKEAGEYTRRRIEEKMSYSSLDEYYATKKETDVDAPFRFPSGSPVDEPSIMVDGLYQLFIL